MSGIFETEALIIGAGAAGLYAADRLRVAGIPFIVLEAAAHGGGRIQSRPELNSALGLVLDEGANLINSTDTIVIRLLNRFNIPYVRRLTPGTDSMHYVHAGRLYDQRGFEREIFTKNTTALARYAEDQAAWNAATDRDNDPRFINESMASYFARISADPMLQTMMTSFFWSEYGRNLAELNLHVLFDYLHIDTQKQFFQLIPNADEAFTVPDGAEQITQGLEAASHTHIRYGHPVTRIHDDGGPHITVEAEPAQGPLATYQARMLFFAAPLHSLNKMTVAVQGLSPEALAEARASTYGKGSKLHLKFRDGFHDLYRFQGILLTDTGEQIWTSGTGQGGAGLLTVLMGPFASKSREIDTATRHVLETLTLVAPGIREYFVGAELSEEPMSYSGALRPGEDADLQIVEGATRWITIGEAAGEDLQGYLEGALRSADRGVTRYIMARRASE